MALHAAGLKERAGVREEVLRPSCDKRRKRGTRRKGLGGSIRSVGDKSRGVVSRKPSENRALRQSDPLSHAAHGSGKTRRSIGRGVQLRRGHW